MVNAPVIKIFVAGEGGVGKTTLIKRYVDGIFDANTIMTIGANFAVKKMITKKGTEIHLQIWDLGGEERFRFILPMYIKGSSGGIICFDTTRYTSLKNLKEGWLQTIKEILPNAPIVLIGTKTDLPESNVNMKEFEVFVKEFNIHGPIMTSSKTGENVDKAFQLVSDLTDY